MAAVVLFAMSGMAQAGVVEGMVQGFGCVVKEKTCPVDRLDPHVGVEKSFVIVDSSGQYYFVPNMDRTVMARNVLNKVRATGKISNKYKAVTAETFEVYRNGQWHKVWSAEMERMESEGRRMGT